MSEKEHIYAAFAKDIKTMERLRRSEDVEYVPGVLKIEKVLILSHKDYDKLAEDISPEYPFLHVNRELMSANEGGWFHSLLVTTEEGPEGMLLAQGETDLYVGRTRDINNANLEDIPMERISLEEPKVYQTQALFHHKARGLSDITEASNVDRPERETNFKVEKVIVLSDEQYKGYKANGLMEDQLFLFDYSDSMWLDLNTFCWHCLLIKGETSKDGLLVEAEGHAYARYTAFISDCDRLRLQDVSVDYQYMERPPDKQKSPHQKGGDAR